MLTALYADSKGEIYDAPGYQAVGRSGYDQTVLTDKDVIPLPEGAELMFLPGRSALAARKGQIQPIAGPLLAVAAMLPVGYTRTLLPAFVRQQEAPVLPLYGYAAVALRKDQMMVAAMKTDNNHKWHPWRYNSPDLAQKVKAVEKELPDNRIVRQLARCSLTWHCCTAQNLFYRRWEAGIPASPVCNANCFGCISLQPAECCPSPQNRIDFSPTSEEIAAVAAYHLTYAPEPIISFGQGCEGEPSLAYAQIAPAIRTVREKTGRGIININTNAGFTEGIRAIVDAGLDSMRVSIISAIPATYQAYYRSSYSLDDVKQSIAYAQGKGVSISLNMLLFPGLNDRPEELAAWRDFLRETSVPMIQLRNLNLDPDAFLSIMPQSVAKAVGISRFVRQLQDWVPGLTIGSFSHYFEKERQQE
ncbi:radical SAM protein [Acetonema longum]|uniref:Radical SAM domain-containing protein n=1 Tax=Acetonema longum DSM 6540 TaxID=1009370 RepID=F7NIJ1_9FIRM|nr:radical SAM protein [Acetonema longum]EGO64137.1 Radical SAM domain-containing protein [Acetonema longum DSM 6540]